VCKLVGGKGVDLYPPLPARHALAGGESLSQIYFGRAGGGTYPPLAGVQGVEN